MSKRAKIITGAAVAVALVAVAAVVWWLLRGDEPAAVDLQAAVAQLETAGGDVSGPSSAAPEPEGGGQGDAPVAESADEVGAAGEGSEAPVATEAAATGDDPAAPGGDTGTAGVAPETEDGGQGAAPVAESANEVGAAGEGSEAPVATEGAATGDDPAAPGGDTGTAGVAAETEDGGEDAAPIAEDAAEVGTAGEAGSDASGTGSEVAATDDADTAGADTAAGGLAGLWKMVTAEGADVSAGEGAVSFAGFRVQEVLAGGIGENTAVGRTAAVSGYIELTDMALVATTVVVKMGTLQTDDSHRDHHMREALNTEEFPMAAFTLVEPLELPAGSFEGEPFSGSAHGDLTIKGVTNRAVFDLQAQLVGDVIVVVGSSEVVFSDYGVPTPTSAAVLSVEDHGIMEFQLYFAR